MATILLSRRFSVFRRNAITEQIVVFASGRSSRPKQTAHVGPSKKTSLHPAHDNTCPFCAGNEDKTPETLFEIKGADGGWQTRAVRNAFPAVMPPEGGVTRVETLLKDSSALNAERPAVGHHEVIIESPRHNAPTSKGSGEDLYRLVRSWWERGNVLARKDPALQHILYFKNQGSVAGASLVHPHAQLVALPFIPRDVRVGHQSNLGYFLDKRVSVFDRTIEEELGAHEEGTTKDQFASRVVELNDDFVAFIPYAATSPFNLWIMPLRPNAHFIEATDADLQSFAAILSNCLRRLDACLNEPDLNILLKSAPLPGRHSQEAYNSSSFFRWYLTITPRLGAGAMAGFELGSGIFSNGNLPEHDAHDLRNVFGR